MRRPAELVPDLPERVHMLGVGGFGMSGLARLLVARGHQVSGVDRSHFPSEASLRALGVDVQLDQGTLPLDAECVVHSAAIDALHPALEQAALRDLPRLKYSEALARVAPQGRTLAVAGTHGKTSTSWLLLHALRGAARSGEASAQPGALIGGECLTLNTNALPSGDQGWFVAEACEYDRSFLQLKPFAAAVTNVEADHLDYYGSLDSIVEAFCRFAERVHPDGLLVLGADVPAEVEAAASARCWRLGRELSFALLSERAGCYRFRLNGPGFESPPVALRIPGLFQAYNAALALGLVAGLSQIRNEPPDRLATAVRTMSGYAGAARRFELWGRFEGIDLVHDYAHHPTEVRATLEAARRTRPGAALHVLFQPHQHSRTARFLGEFAEALRFADSVLVGDVYGARSHIDGERMAGAPELVARLRALGVDASAGGTPESCVVPFAERLAPPCLALVLGAGDIDRIKNELLAVLALRSLVPRSAC